MNISCPLLLLLLLLLASHITTVVRVENTKSFERNTAHITAAK